MAKRKKEIANVSIRIYPSTRETLKRLAGGRLTLAEVVHRLAAFNL